MRLFAAVICTCLGVAAAAAPLPPPEQAFAKLERKVHDSLTGKREGIAKAVGAAFDFDELARRSLGDAWDAQSKADRERFAALLRDVITLSYLPKVQKTPDYGIAIKSTDKAGDEATVHTVASAKDASIPLDFKLTSKGGRWAIFDTVIDGVGLVETYNEQFSRALAKNGMAGLLKSLEARKAQLESTAK